MDAAKWQCSKGLGNEHYKNGRFEDALVAWNDSLSFLGSSDDEGLMQPQEKQKNSDQEAMELAAAALAGSSEDVLRLLSPPKNGGTASELNINRSTIYANMAQAKLQLKDSQGAINDCNCSLFHDPSNSKALVRRGLAYEELGKLTLALEDMNKAFNLPLSASLIKVVGSARSRLQTNMRNDQSLLAKCTDHHTLVNRDQTLRIHLHSSPPKEMESNQPFRVDVNIANEFGLWRPKDFNTVCRDELLPLLVTMRPHRGEVDHLRLSVVQLDSTSSNSSSASFSSISLSSPPLTTKNVIDEKQYFNSQKEFLAYKTQIDTEFLNVIWINESAQASMEVNISINAPLEPKEVSVVKEVSVFLEITPLNNIKRTSVSSSSLSSSTTSSLIDLRPIMPVLSLPITLNPKPETLNHRRILFNSWDHIGAHCCRLTSIDIGDGAFIELKNEINVKMNEKNAKKLEVVVAESPGHLGIGGKVWDAALVLLHYLNLEQGLVKDKVVVELGAGTGLVGIACHQLGAKKVIITDLAEVCELIAVNINLNQSPSSYTVSSLEEASVHDQTSESMEAVPIGWSDPAPPLPKQVLGTIKAMNSSQEYEESTASVEINIDTIVLSDVVYDPELYLPLVATLSALVLPPSPVSTQRPVEIVLAHRHRNPMDPQFWAALICAGFSVNKVDLEVVGLANVVLGGGAAADVNVFRVNRVSAGGSRDEIARAVADAIPI